jgi:predicted nucleic acid-binding protein
VSLVVDASVAFKWVVGEPGSERAIALRNESSLIAPAQLISEVGNALWKAVRRREVAASDAVPALRSILRVFDGLVPNEQLHERALKLAVDLNHPIYGCFYLALAERERAALVSADERLLRAAKKVKGIEVRAL